MMNFRVTSWSCAVALCLGSVLANPAIATVTIIGGEIRSEVYDGASGISAIDDLFGTIDDTATASLPGLFSETTRASTSTTISASIDQHRTGIGNDAAFGFTYADFTVDADVSYSLGGSFANSSGNTFFWSYLVDTSTATYLFYNYLDNIASEPFTAVLGATNGNSDNSFSGSLTGNLVAGHVYQWFAYGFTRATPNADDGATATGNAWLKVGDDPPTEIVPESASIAVWSCLGLTAIGFKLWRGRPQPRTR